MLRWLAKLLTTGDQTDSQIFRFAAMLLSLFLLGRVTNSH